MDHDQSVVAEASVGSEDLKRGIGPLETADFEGYLEAIRKRAGGKKSPESWCIDLANELAFGYWLLISGDDEKFSCQAMELVAYGNGKAVSEAVLACKVSIGFKIAELVGNKEAITPPYQEDGEGVHAKINYLTSLISPSERNESLGLSIMEFLATSPLADLCASNDKLITAQSTAARYTLLIGPDSFLCLELPGVSGGCSPPLSLAYEVLTASILKANEMGQKLPEPLSLDERSRIVQAFRKLLIPSPK